MATDDLPQLPGDWRRQLAAEVVTPLEPGRAAGIAAAAATAASGAAVATGVTAVAVAKVAAAVAATITAATLIAAAAGILPDPIQNWVADMVDGIGISLPRPDELISTTVPTLPTVTVPEITLPVVTLP